MAQRLNLFFYCSFLFFAIDFISHTIALTKEQENDRITALPGQPRVNFSQFSGYVTVNEKHGRALFYWLTEAESHPQKQPLVLWLNGGPGCSSIAYGASEEIGPFLINKNGLSLRLNEYSWNKVANLLFLESPAGVGFSYTNTSSDLRTTGDERTAQDALIFLIRWFERFPQYNHRQFYLTGESYAGHYIPQLAKKIVQYNKENPHSPINFKGFLIGNAFVDDYTNSQGTIFYWWSHALISGPTYDKILRLCELNSSTPHGFSKECQDITAYAQKTEMGHIDPYSIYTPVCIQSPNKASNRPIKFRNSLLTRKRHSSYDPCSEKYAEKYYNAPEVQKALHANTTGIAYKWTDCSEVLFRGWKDAPRSTLPIFKELMANTSLRMWLFSGDTDTVCSVTDTRLALQRLNLKIKTPWYPWYLDHQVGGWTEIYDGLTFVTVRGAGHEVPHIQPARGFRLFKSFLSGENLPGISKTMNYETV